MKAGLAFRVVATLPILLAFSATSAVAAPPSTISFPDNIPPLELVLKLSILSEHMYDIDSVDSEHIPDFVDRTELFKEVVDDGGSSETLVGTFRMVDVDGEEREHMFFALRGSDEDADWSANADFGLGRLGSPGNPVLGQSSPVRVHGGFSEAAFQIYDDIDLAVHSILNSTTNIDDDLAHVDGKPVIYATGHSKGGGEAQIISAYMAHLHPDLSVQLINFGGPQVGNEAFKQWVERLDNLSTFRFVNKNDLVPRLPPFYAKCGHLIQIERSSIKAYWRQEGGGDGYIGISSNWNWGMSVDDHNMYNYVGMLEETLLDPNIMYPSHFERRGGYPQQAQQQLQTLEINPVTAPEDEPEDETDNAADTARREEKLCCFLWVFNCKAC
eukprot:CAMPEP_0181047792 /NCGR_PEP_ID=MMETSP1070-20121207/15079_1 /TAXON_ID=265543 /ORGANISM="Minutocellus polymorphus, Strain NH13" /LENGTH=384 /DNA_ID=CAMNT_0023126509 /DNA_START=466 /DNA_END=1620 /DNA_ORIENTATION=-